MSKLSSRSLLWVALVGAGSIIAPFPVTALDDLSHYIFVPNRNSADIAVIDTRSDHVAHRLTVGNVPHQVAVSETEMKLIASNTADNTVTVIDLATLQTEATVPLGHEPEHMEIDARGKIAAIGNIGGGTISFLSLESNLEVARVDGLFEPHNMTFNADGSLLYVGNLGADFVSVVDIAKGEVINEIPVGEAQITASTAGRGAEYQGIINVTATPDGRLGFAAYGEGDQMAVIDLATQETIDTLDTGSLPWRAFSTADGAYMIVPNNGDETISIFSTTTLDEVARLPGAADMTGANTGLFDTIAFVISRGDDKLIVLDLIKMERIGEIALAGTPETGVVTPDGNKLYVALSGSDEIGVIDIRSQKLVGRIDDVGDEPWGAHMVGALNYCH